MSPPTQETSMEDLTGRGECHLVEKVASCEMLDAQQKSSELCLDTQLGLNQRLDLVKLAEAGLFEVDYDAEPVDLVAQPELVELVGVVDLVGLEQHQEKLHCRKMQRKPGNSHLKHDVADVEVFVWKLGALLVVEVQSDEQS